MEETIASFSLHTVSVNAFRGGVSVFQRTRCSAVMPGTELPACVLVRVYF